MHFILIVTDPLSDSSGLSVRTRLDIMTYVSPNFSINDLFNTLLFSINLRSSTPPDCSSLNIKSNNLAS